MKTMKVLIKDHKPTDAGDASAFEFGSEEDKLLFLSLMPDFEAFSYVAKGKTYYAYHKAWDILEGRGWYHDGFENNGGTRSFIIWKFPENCLEKLEQKLKHFDWYYEFSDDYSVWDSGNKKWKEILRLKEEVSSQYGEDVAVELYNKYNPDNE